MWKEVKTDRGGAYFISGQKIKIRTDASNAACRRVAEKCGAMLAGYEPDVLARAFIRYMDTLGKEPTEDPKTLEKRREYTEYIPGQ